MNQKTRLQILLGPFSILLNPLWSFFILTIISIILMAIASHPKGIPLVGLSTYLLFMAIRLEEQWFEVTPLAPLTVICLGAWIRCGLGGLLLSLGASIEGNPVWQQELPKIQILWLCLMTSMVIVFSMIKPRKVVQNQCFTHVEINSRLVVGLAIFSGCFAMCTILYGSIGGTLDRSPENYYHWLKQDWQPDTFLTIFAKFRDIFFIVLPLAVARSKAKITKSILLGIFLIYILLAIPLGGRGLILYPLLLSCGGLWLTQLNPKTIRYIVIAFFVFSIALIPSIAAYGAAKLYSQDPEGLIQENFSGIKVFNSYLANIDVKKHLSKAGKDLYACSDAYLFVSPSIDTPRAGSYRLTSLLTAWIPDLLMRRDLPIRNSHIIAEEAKGIKREDAESKVYTSYPCISFGGELFWRGDWKNVIFGSLAAALLYRVVSELWYKYSGWNTLWKLLLLLYPTTFIVMYPLGSLGETAWNWMWDLPKYCLAIMLYYLMAKSSQQKHQ